MTLLSIVQDVTKETGIINTPLTVIGNTDPAVEKLLRLSNQVGLRLQKAYDWQVLREEQTFTSVATETQTSILPADFDRIATETFWNRTDEIMINGPAGSSEWQGLKARSYSNTRIPKFTYRGDAILVIPTLDAGKTLAYEYVKKNWCQSSALVAQSKWAADDDTGILDEELLTLGLVWRYLANEGLPANAEAEAFQDYFDRLRKQERRVAGVLVAGDIFGQGRHYGGVPGGGGGYNINTGW